MATLEQADSVAISSLTVAHKHELTATTQKAFRTHRWAQLVTISPNASRKLHDGHWLFKRYFERKAWTFLDFHIRQMVYVDHPPLATLTTDSKADKYSKLFPQAYGPFPALHTTDRTLTLDGNCVPSINSVKRATLTIGTTERPHHL